MRMHLCFTKIVWKRILYRGHCRDFCNKPVFEFSTQHSQTDIRCVHVRAWVHARARVCVCLSAAWVCVFVHVCVCPGGGLSDSHMNNLALHHGDWPRGACLLIMHYTDGNTIQPLNPRCCFYFSVDSIFVQIDEGGWGGGHLTSVCANRPRHNEPAFWNI